MELGIPVSGEEVVEPYGHGPGGGGGIPGGIPGLDHPGISHIFHHGLNGLTVGGNHGPTHLITSQGGKEGDGLGCREGEVVCHPGFRKLLSVLLNPFPDQREELVPGEDLLPHAVLSQDHLALSAIFMAEVIVVLLVVVPCLPRGDTRKREHKNTPFVSISK